MSEFASLAMVRVLERGLFELQMGSPRIHNKDFPKTLGGATVNLDVKRALLMHAIREGGVSCLVQLGRGVHHFSDEPTHRAMTSAFTPFELLQRWQRLEKYIHSLHRIEVLESGENHACLAHRSRRVGSEPDLAESLVVMGVLACLFEAMGAVDVAVHKGAIPVFPHLLEQDAAASSLLDPISDWIFRWSTVQKKNECLADLTPSNLFDASDWPFLAKQVGNVCVKELMSSPSLALIAQRLAISPRSLQRRLSEAGLSYGQLLGEARRRMAAWRLLATPASLSEVGFFSGYADQAHFTREFRKSVGLTPAQYRKEFAKGQQAWPPLTRCSATH